jgi:hypothetical protein
MFKAQNLIRNGSFENISPPASWNNWGGEFISYSQTPIHRVLLDWDEFNSADLLAGACTHTYSGTPMNLFGYCQPENGSNYAGIMTFGGSSTEVKEYIYQQLTSPLQAGKIYCLNYYVSKSDRTSIATKNLDAFFSINLPIISPNGYLIVTPQISNQTGFISDTTNWIQIQGCYTAIGGEQYLTIGNFNANINTDTLLLGTVNPFTGNPPIAYYYIDDITLIDQSTVGINELVNVNAIKISPNPVTDVLNIDISTTLDATKNLTIKITDVLGKSVYTYPPLEGAGGGSYPKSINLSHLETGIYFVSILQGNQSLVTKKVVKQ